MQLIKDEQFIHRELTYKYDTPEESQEHRRQMIAAGYTLMSKTAHYALYRKKVKRAEDPPSLHPQ